MDAMVLKLIHFNQKNTCEVVKTLSSTAQNEMINLFLLDTKQACRQPLYSKNKELITGVEHHKLANHNLCKFHKGNNKEAAASEETVHKPEMSVKDLDNRALLMFISPRGGNNIKPKMA